jgi:hypothetical protein
LSRDDEEQQLDEIDVEILGLGESGDVFSNDQGPTSAILSPRTPKRPRPSPDRDSPDLYDLEMEVEEADDEDFEQPNPKKPRRTSRTNEKVQTRDILLKDLKGRRASKETPSRTSAKEKSKARKPMQPKEQPRSLPVGDLVIVSERFESPDAEEDVGRRSIHTI